MKHRRLAASASLVLLVLAIAAAVGIAVSAFPRGLWVSGCVLVALPVAWYGGLHRGAARWISLVLAALLLLAALALMIVVGPFLGELAVVLLLALAFAAARAAFPTEVELPAAPRPQRAVLFWNPRSGDGKAVKFHLVDEARARGIEPIELGPGDDLGALVRDVVGALDALVDGRERRVDLAEVAARCS